MFTLQVLCIGHVNNWSGGGERAGPRNNGNSLTTAVEFCEKQKADTNALLLLSILRCVFVEDLLLNGNL